MVLRSSVSNVGYTKYITGHYVLSEKQWHCVNVVRENGYSDQLWAFMHCARTSRGSCWSDNAKCPELLNYLYVHMYVHIYIHIYIYIYM